MSPLSIVPNTIKKLAEVMFVNPHVKTVHASILECLHNQHLPMVFQPIINHSRGEIFAHESLSRPEFRGTSIRPDVWFMVAHDYKHSLETDLLAIRCAMKQSNIGPRYESKELLFINIMSSSLLTPSFKTELEALFRHGLCRPEQLVLEITEHISYDPSTLAHALVPYKEIGIRFALDDVGLGASNLTSIVELEPDFIKLDRALVAGVASSPSKQKMLSQLVEYMENGDSVIAEGIENEEDLTVVKQTGVNLSQGYLWGKPQSFPLVPTAQQLFQSHHSRGDEQTPTSIQLSSRQNGSVQIIDGTLVVRDPQGIGRFATVEVPSDERIKVTVNDNAVKGRIVVQESDCIVIDTKYVAPISRVFLRESSDDMEVVAVRQITLGEKCRLVDKEESSHLVFDVQTEVVYPEPVHFDSIIELLNSSGYQGTYDEDGVRKVCNAVATVEATVLRGQFPIPGLPDTYTEIERAHVYDPLHRRMQTPTVTAGTAIATIVKGTPGIPGRTVLGQPVQPPVPQATPVLGDGIAQISNVLIALRPGRPLISRERIDVIPELVIHRDLSSKDGNIDFDGDVIAYGSILDGAYIRASGTVTVRGSILCATVMAERGIFASGSVVGSQLIAGPSRLLYQKLETTLRRLIKEYDHFHSDYKTLLKHATETSNRTSNIDMLASLLIDQRHPVLLNLFEQMTTNFNELTVKDLLFSQLVHELRTKWLSIQRTRLHEQDTELLYERLVSFLFRVESMASATPADIRIDSITSSVVRATGKIVVKGSGVFTSTLESDDVVLVKGNVRGGFIIAKNAVRIKELGTRSGTETSVQVMRHQGYIAVRTRNSNTLLQVGKNRDRNFTDQANIIYRGV